MQIRELRQYVEARGWMVAESYIDAGVSGRKASRPALDRLMADAKARKFDCVAVWKLDRWGRTVAQLVTDVMALDSAGVRFISLRDGIDTDQNNATGRLLMHIMAAFAEFERSVIQERVQTGWKQYRADYAAGKRPASKSGKNLPIGRPKAIFDRDRVRQLRAEGKSWAEICAETGLPKTTVRRVAKEQ